jgi:hypothetical protein
MPTLRGPSSAELGLPWRVVLATPCGGWHGQALRLAMRRLALVLMEAEGARHSQASEGLAMPPFEDSLLGRATRRKFSNI